MKRALLQFKPAVWLVDTSTFSFPLRSQRWLEPGLVSCGELEIAARYANAKSQMQYLTGRALVRHALASVTPRGAEPVRIVVDEQGKPVLASALGEAPWHFNISHSGDLVACALASANVGIDIESISRATDHLAIAHAYFSSDEAIWIGARQGSVNRRFVALWTVKEAYLKAIGIGLAVPVAGVVISAVRQRCCTVVSNDLPGAHPWHCRLMKPTPDFWLALCCEQAFERPLLNWARL
jgi:4'-phosphopantetheinyl transferase